LASRLLFRDGGVLIAAEHSYDQILRVAKDFGAEVIRLPLDEQGLVVESLLNHPRLADVRAVYVTPHHQYPTTVTLPPARRIQLLDLAEKHRFAILEDDYDYDFHYHRPPHLPLAAMDRHRSVIYIGSFTKVLAPTLRIGYLIGPKNFVDGAHHHRLLTDRQGDLILERALANYIEAGNLERHLRRVRPIYHQRRDLLLELLQEQFGEEISCVVPAGGMAIWVKFQDDLQLKVNGLSTVWINSTHSWWEKSHCLRLGFASLNEEEMRTAINALREMMVRS
jgi:GntR family transcriptional regulator/MocR family aminotransferase